MRELTSHIALRSVDSPLLPPHRPPYCSRSVVSFWWLFSFAAMDHSADLPSLESRVGLVGAFTKLGRLVRGRLVASTAVVGGGGVGVCSRRASGDGAGAGADGTAPAPRRLSRGPFLRLGFKRLCTRRGRLATRRRRGIPCGRLATRRRRGILCGRLTKRRCRRQARPVGEIAPPSPTRR